MYIFLARLAISLSFALSEEMIDHGFEIKLSMHVLGLMNIHETMTCEYFTNMISIITLELNSGKHGEALVHNTLLEVVVGVQVLLGLPLWNHYGFTGDTVH